MTDTERETLKREAAAMALEALRDHVTYTEDKGWCIRALDAIRATPPPSEPCTDPDCPDARKYGNVHRDPDDDPRTIKCEGCETYLRDDEVQYDADRVPLCHGCMAELREDAARMPSEPAAPAPQAEPVAWRYQCSPGEVTWQYSDKRPAGYDKREPLYAHPPTPAAALFRTGPVTLHSGDRSNWKIDCDAFTDEDWTTLAAMVVERIAPFGSVVGVPRGGNKLARALLPFVTEGSPLVVDDVLTTGASLLAVMPPGSRGLVVFARGLLPPNVTALFMMAPAAAVAVCPRCGNTRPAPDCCPTCDAAAQLTVRGVEGIKQDGRRVVWLGTRAHFEGIDADENPVVTVHSLVYSADAQAFAASEREAGRREAQVTADALRGELAIVTTALREEKERAMEEPEEREAQPQACEAFCIANTYALEAAYAPAEPTRFAARVRCARCGARRDSHGLDAKEGG